MFTIEQNSAVTTWLLQHGVHISHKNLINVAIAEPEVNKR